MKTPLRVLIVEDSEFDAQMMVSLLRKGGYDVTFARIETADAMQAALREARWQLVLADYNLPDFNASAALGVLQVSGLDLPFIIVSGGIGEDIAVAAMKAGAHVAGIARYIQTGAHKLNWRATETFGLRKGSIEFPIEVSFSDMQLDGHRRFVGFIRDITERKRAERELRENQEQFAIAREIQQRLFPKTAPACPGFDIAGATYPAEATGGAKAARRPS